MDNIIINFTADPSGLQPGIDGLLQLETVDKELATAVKANSAEIDKRNKSLSDSAKAGKKDVEGLTTAFSNLGKSAVGGTYNKALTDLTKNLKGTKDEFKQLSLVLDVAKKKLADLNPNSAEWKEMNDLIFAGQQILKEFGDQEDKTTVKTKSLRQELRLMREEIAQKNLAGESGPELDALIAKAGELDDALKDVSTQISNTGSDTRNIEGFVQIVGTGTQAIAGLQAAQSLLGDENEEFQKVMVKLNALLVISNSIQSVQAALQKESAASLLIENAQRRIAALSTQLQTAAESEYVVVRYGAIAAQKALNAVMALSPAGILLIALGALAAAVVYFTSTTDKATEAQKKFNQELQDAIDYEEQYSEIKNRTNDINLEKLKLNGASEQLIREQRLKNLQDDLARTKKIEEENKAGYDAAIEIRRKIANEESNIDEKRNEEAQKTIKAFDDLSRKRIELEDKVALTEVKNRIATKEEIEKFDEDAEQAREAAFEKEKTAREKRLSDIATLIERDRKARQAQAKLELEDEKRARESVIDNENSAPAVKLQALEESFAFSRKLLEQEKNFALTNEKLTGEERKLVVQKYLSDLAQLEQENGKRVVDILKASGEAEAKATREALEKRKSEIENNRGGRISLLQQEIIQNDQILATTKLTSDEQLKIRQDTVNKIAAISRQEMIQAGELYGANLISYKEYQEALTKAAQTGFQSRQEQAQLDLEQEEATINRRLDLQQRASDATKAIGDLLFDNSQSQRQRELDDNQKLFDRKVISEREFNNRKDQIAKAEAARQKEKAIFDIAIQTAKSLFQIQAQAAAYTASFNFAGAALAESQIPLLLGEAALQIALVAGKKYRHGGLIDGPGTSTSDSIPAWLSKGEYVTKAEMTGKHKPVLEAINNDKFQDYLIKYEMPKFYEQFSMPVVPDYAEHFIQTMSHEKIDYERLGSVIGKSMAENPRVSVHVDENGIVTMVHTGLETIEYKNKKLLM